jgi:CBS domain-containing protein
MGVGLEPEHVHSHLGIDVRSPSTAIFPQIAAVGPEDEGRLPLLRPRRARDAVGTSKKVEQMSEIRIGDPVEKLVRRGAVYVWPDTSLREVAETLEREAIGLVLVHRTGGVAGVVSERDIIRAVAEGADPDVERAADVMTYDVTFVHADDPIELVATTMIEGDVRHVPVDGQGGGTGVVSIRDVLPVFVAGAAEVTT